MSKPKKKLPKYNANKAGVLLSDPEVVSAIVSSLKRSFSRSPTVRDFLNKYRREEVWLKKDGTKAKKPRVFYPCFQCHKEFNSNSVQVDHVEPVVPLNIPVRHMCFNVLIDRLYCDESNLQILCKEHHKDKSQQENQIRKEWITKTKYIVYRTVNKINQKKYIGIHKCEDYDDGYMGSGTVFKSALAKYGKASFYRHILYVFDNLEEARVKERELVDQDIVDSDNYYNLVLGGAYSGMGGTSSNKIKIICHETGEVFDSLTDAAYDVGISISSIVKALDNPGQVAKNLHFFTNSSYSPSIKVSYPSIGKPIICLNNGLTYKSIRDAADSLGLNYKSLRNALVEPNEDGFYTLHDVCFIYEDEFDSSIAYKVKRKKIRCVETGKTFDTCVEAARYLKHKNPNLGGIAIGRAIRQGIKMYKYSWEEVITEVDPSELKLQQK